MLLLILFLFTVFGLPKIGTAAPTDSLWQKAVEISAASEDWVPGLIIEKEEVFDEDGKLEESSEVHLRFIPEKNGEIAIKLIKAIENGKEVTEEARDEIEKYLQELEEDEEDNPFNPGVQQNITIKRLNRTRVINDKKCIAYEYKQKTKDAEWYGTAWLEVGTGIPVEVQSEPDPLPPIEEGVEAESLSVIIRYDYTAEGAWYVKEAIVDIGIKVKILPLVTFKGTVHNVTTFSEYWKYGAKNEK